MWKVILPFADQTSSWLVLPSARCAATSHLALINNDTFPLVAVAPLFPPFNNATPALTGRGISVRVLRIAKLPTRSSNQACPISLLAHMKPLHRHHHDHPLSNSSSSFRVQYLPVHNVRHRETTARFKRAALQLLDGLARDTLWPARITSGLPPCSMTYPMIAPPGWPTS